MTADESVLELVGADDENTEGLAREVETTVLGRVDGVAGEEGDTAAEEAALTAVDCRGVLTTDDPPEASGPVVERWDAVAADDDAGTAEVVLTTTRVVEEPTKVGRD